MLKKEISSNVPVQIEGITNPYEQRVTEAGTRRLSLNSRERMYARKRKLAAKVAALIATLPYEQALGPILAQEGIDSSEVNSMLTDTNSWDNEDVYKLRKAVRTRVAEMFLDVQKEKPYTNDEIAAAVGISRAALRKLIASEEFQNIYNDNFFRAVSDPRIKAVQEATAELAPLVFTTLRDLLTKKSTSDNARLRAATFLAEHLGLVKETGQHSDRNELAKFLGERNINLTNINVSMELPEAFRQEVEKFMPKENSHQEMYEGEFVNSEDTSKDKPVGA